MNNSPGRLPASRRPPKMIGTLAFPGATALSAYSYDISSLFVGQVTEYVLETGSLGSSLIAFDTSTGIFSSASVAAVADLTGLSVTAVNNGRKSFPTNTDTLVIT